MFKKADDGESLKTVWGLTSPLKRHFAAGLALGIAIGISLGRLL